MSLGAVAFAVAAVLYALIGLDIATGDANIWGHFFVALGLLLGGVSLDPRRWQK